ncbi:MAG TPA: spore coat U domain-containing protein [Rhizomicrobium sp.]
MRIRSGVIALILLAVPRPAHALLCGTILDPISVSATALAFGNYSAAAQSTANNTVTISCGLLGIDLLPNFTVGLSAGRATVFSPRKMFFGTTNTLNYNIYTTPGFATIWGDGSSGTATQTFNSSLLSLGTINFTGYGRLPAGQFVAPGAYMDTLTVTVTF